MNTFNIVKYTHLGVVVAFLLIYLVKTILLVANKKEMLEKITKAVKVPEMIISFTFLASGIYLLTQLPEINMLMIIKLICVFASIPIAIIGFKKSNKALAVLSLLLIIGSYGLAEVSAKKKAAGNASDKVATNDGKTLYTNYCTKCHGEDGKAGIMSATDLSLSQVDDNTSYNIIKNGQKSMPAFAAQLNEEQLNAVRDYVKTLRK